jgi:hypothetical protein
MRAHATLQKLVTHARWVSAWLEELATACRSASLVGARPKPKEPRAEASFSKSDVAKAWPRHGWLGLTRS